MDAGRVITTRLCRRGPDEAAFDRAFWAAVEPAKRLELVWDMVLEMDLWQGGDGTHPRLQKSVSRLQRRRVR